MSEQSFEQLAEQAASGLRGDRELFLDVKQELCSHLEEKSDHYASQGHSREESVELAGKSLGSPMDVASELLNANKRRMNLRSLFRITFGALIVPLAIVLSIYVGYGRLVRLQGPMARIVDSDTADKLPAVPFIGANPNETRNNASIRVQLASGSENAEKIRRYWESHKQDPDSKIYYAYYAIFLKPRSETSYVNAMRLGQQLEPENALYNLLLADYYLKQGIKPRLIEPSQPSEKVINRRALEIGTSELLSASKKPYMRSYQMRIVQKKLKAGPRPVFTEDYIYQISAVSSEQLTQFTRYRDLARSIPACARLLSNEGRRQDALAVMDTWRPVLRLFMSDSNSTFTNQLMIGATAAILTKEAPKVYDQLEATAKSKDASATGKRLDAMRKRFKNASASSGFAPPQSGMVRRHGAVLAAMLLPAFRGASVTESELTPGRMLDHILVEQMVIQTVMVLLLLALIGSLFQGILWLRRLRRAASVPLLLMIPSKLVIKALVLGIALPVVVYYIYSRMPLIGGRQYGWTSGMHWRFFLELLVLSLVMLNIPVRLIRNYIRCRCTELDIPVPDVTDERRTNRKVRYATLASSILLTVVAFIPVDVSPVLRTIAVLLALGLVITAIRYADRKRGDYGLYYGTVARSLTIIHAASIIFISITIQPFMLYSETQWLKQDKLHYGYLSSKQGESMCFTAIEERASHTYAAELAKALNGN